jgi:hypothetical protein
VFSFSHRLSGKWVVPTIRPRRRRERGAVCEPLESRRLLSAAGWTGAAGDNQWFNPANWQGDQIPAQREDVVFPSETGNITYVNIGSNVTVGNLDLVGHIALGGASITVDGTIDSDLYDNSIDSLVLGHNTPVDCDSEGTLHLDNISDGGHGYGLQIGTTSSSGNEGSLSIGGDVYGFDGVGVATYTGLTEVIGDGSDGGRGVLSVACPLASPVQVDSGGYFSDSNGQMNGLIVESGGMAELTGGLTSTDGLAAGAGAYFGIGSSATDFTGATVTAGAIDIAGANLGVAPAPESINSGDVLTLIWNLTGQPVTGTFAGLPQGSLVGDEYVINYTGGASGRDVTLTATKSATEVSIASSPAPTPLNGTSSLQLSPGQQITLTATVQSAAAGTPSGTVTFADFYATIGVAPLIDGVASYTYTVPPDGGSPSEAPVSAAYDGDIAFAPATSTNSIEVSYLVGTHVALTSSRTALYQGENVTLIADLSLINPNDYVGLSPTGTITFYDNGTAIGTEKVTITGDATIDDPLVMASLGDNSLPLGFNSITASYSGGDGFFLETTASAMVVAVHRRAGGTTPTISSTTTDTTTDGTTIALSVTGSDTGPGGAAGLRYTWTAIHLPAGAKVPRFSHNGINAAQDVVATFSKAGGYILRCEAKNAAGNAATTDISVTVTQTATALKIEPHDAHIAENSTLQYTGAVLDQFNHPMRSAQALSFLVASGPGSITSGGQFSAGSIAGRVEIELESDDLTAMVGAVVGV